MSKSAIIEYISVLITAQKMKENLSVERSSTDKAPLNNYGGCSSKQNSLKPNGGGRLQDFKTTRY